MYFGANVLVFLYFLATYHLRLLFFKRYMGFLLCNLVYVLALMR